MKAITGRTLYYSSLPNNEDPQKAPKGKASQSTPPRRKDVPQSSPSPRKTIENASSLTSAVVTSVNSAKKIKNRARSFVPKKLLSAQCTPMARGRGDLDEATPVIFYQDEDVVVKPAEDSNTSFIDPFAFVDSEDGEGDKKDDDDFNSPTSVIPVRLFHEEKGPSNDVSATKKGEENNSAFDKEVVTFECPIFNNDYKFDEDDTSIDVSSAIKSINAVSIKEEIKAFRESIRAKREARGESLELWEEPILSWDGFTRSTSFTKCEWEPKADEVRNGLVGDM